MCEKKKCQHDPKDLCTCGPVQNGNAFQLAVHVVENMTDVKWELDYQGLAIWYPYSICLIGKCKVCGGRLCVEQKPFESRSLDDFLAAAYRYLYQFHRNLGQSLNRTQFRKKFVEMFHEPDRAFIQAWLDRPENQSVASMYRRSSWRVYTIVHTAADADKGHFPPPMGEASYSDEDVARRELKRFVEAEKEGMEIPFSEEEYREESGDDFWEAYRDGYAAGWFTRYEIIESRLYSSTAEEEAQDGE